MDAVQWQNPELNLTAISLLKLKLETRVNYNITFEFKVKIIDVNIRGIIYSLRYRTLITEN